MRIFLFVLFAMIGLVLLFARHETWLLVLTLVFWSIYGYRRLRQPRTN